MPNDNHLNDKERQSPLNIKTYGYIIVTIIFMLGIFTFPIDLSLIKLIIVDIISSI